MHRFRTVFFSDDGRFSAGDNPADAERLMRVRLRESVRSRNAASFVIADCRLSDASHPLLQLFPAELRIRLTGVRQGAAGMRAASASRRSRWRALWPWVAAAATAGTGFWVFVNRAL